MKECLGCQLATNQLPVYVVYENELVSCFLDHDPYNEGHTLILPKSHVSELDELDWATASEIMRISMVIAKALKNLYKPEGITINQNNGVFNELTHYHMHVVPRFTDRSFEDFYSNELLENGHLKERLMITKETVRAEIEKLICMKK